MKLPKLDERLSAIAGMVRADVRVADVGTDHGHLIAWLVASGKIPGGCACDINEKPLEKAAFSLREYDVSNQVNLILCDGLSGVAPENCDDIVIAGMGGDTIWHILSAAPWLYNPHYRLVLQPMSKTPFLRQKLYENGFEVLQECAAVSGGFPYCVMVAAYTGQRQEILPSFAWGGFLQNDDTPPARAYIERVCCLLEQKVAGLSDARNRSSEKMEYQKILACLRREQPQSYGGNMTVQQVYRAIDAAAPFSTQMDFDNAGLLVGDAQAVLTGVVLALDVTEHVINEAVAMGANLIVTHHPVIFHAMKRVTSDTLVYRLIREGISVICAHTNLDIASGGVNDVLAAKLELKDVSALLPENLLRVGNLQRGMTPPELAYYVKQKLDLPALRYCDGGRAIERVAVCGGSGGGELQAAAEAGCQAYITGDVKHDVMLEAAHKGMTLIDGGHFGTETHVLEALAQIVRSAAGDVDVIIARSNEVPYATI